MTAWARPAIPARRKPGACARLTLGCYSTRAASPASPQPSRPLARFEPVAAGLAQGAARTSRLDRALGAPAQRIPVRYPIFRCRDIALGAGYYRPSLPS
jgi:hypothetical protein